MALPTNYVSKVWSWRHSTANPVTMIKQTWVDAATIVTNGFSASHAGPNTTTQSMTLGGSLCTAGVGQNDFARNVVITVTHGSSVVAETGTITGTDIYGKVQTEDWSVTAGTTSKTFTGAKAFKAVTAITETAASDASANSTIAGNGKKLGLANAAVSIIPLAELEDTATPTAGAIVAASTVSTADPRGTYAPNSTLNGALDFTIVYPCVDPTL